jgi:hypothetical protein
MNMARASICLNRALVYVDRTTDPPLLRFLEPNDDYEIIDWKKESDPDRPYRYRVYWTIRLKDGRTIVLDNDELKHIDLLLEIKRKLEADSIERFLEK